MRWCSFGFVSTKAYDKQAIDFADGFYVLSFGPTLARSLARLLGQSVSE